MHAYIKKSVWFKGFKMSWFYLEISKNYELEKKKILR